MTVTGRPTLRDLFDESPTPRIVHLPCTHQRHSYVTTDGSYRSNGGGFGVVIETHDGERVACIAPPGVSPDNNVSGCHALHLGPNVFAHRTPPDTRVGVLVNHDDLVVNVNNAALADDHPDWQSPKRIVVPTGSEHHWRGVQACIAGFKGLHAARVGSRENPTHPLANAPNEYEHVNRRADRCVLPDPPEFEADSGTDVSYPPPSRFEGRTSDWTQAVVDDPPFAPSTEWAVEHEQSHRGGAVPGRHRRATVPSPAGHSSIKKLTTRSDDARHVDPAETVSAFDPRRRELSPLGATARRYACRLVIIALLTAVVVVVAVHDLGPLSPTAGVSTAVVDVDGPAFPVRLELGVLVGVLATDVSLVALVDRGPTVDLRAASGWLALAAANFLVRTVAAQQFAPGLVDVLVERDHVAAGSRQSTLEFELFFPVAVGDGIAVAPLLLRLRRAGALSRRPAGQTRRLSFLCLVALAACLSPPNSTTFALYTAPPAVGLGVAVAWTEFG